MRAIHALPAAVLFLAACDAETRTGQVPTSPTSRTPPAGRLSIVSGNEQQAKAGEPLREPFVVRVIDDDGRGLGDVVVSYSLTSGDGVFARVCDPAAPVREASTRTNADGLAQMTFQPTSVGASTVTARVVGARDVSVAFTTNAVGLVIEFWFGIWEVGFAGPCLAPHVTVPLWTVVEWTAPPEDERYPLTYTVTSTSTPPGGAAFDSGMLRPKERYRFVPGVAGTWEYHDRITGLAGRLTAR
jgi:hypothetical protein